MHEPLLLFAPGAGAASTSAWMQRYAHDLERIGKVVRFDYDYMKAGRRAPDPLPRLIASHCAALAETRREHQGKVILIGKSMGGRIGCHVALQETVSGVVCLGYPLKGAGRTQPLRDEVLIRLKTPVLFVQGSRDPLCPLDLLAATRARMSAPNQLFVVAGGDHSLKPSAAALRARPGTRARDIEAEIIAEIEKFVGHLGA